jgi:CheY-like chemotaxis protein
MGHSDRKRILLVDDYLPFLASLRLALSMEHDVTVASSGDEALAALKSEQGFDAVLCDLSMPGVSGMELFRRVNPEVARRFVFLTGGGVTGESERFLAEVVNPTLRKPFDVRALSQTLARMWEVEPAKAC